jgi:hypothetical protein
MIQILPPVKQAAREQLGCLALARASLFTLSDRSDTRQLHQGVDRIVATPKRIAHALPRH